MLPCGLVINPVPARRAAVAGSWYPGEQDVLLEEVDRYLSGAESADVPHPIGIVAPHAGLMFSGPVAAHAYHLLQPAQADVAVLVGPSHYVGFKGVALYPKGVFETPLGALKIDEECAAAIAAASDCVVENTAPHAREHSLEMQLPFLKRVLPDIAIVPLVMGYQRRETIYDLGRAIAAAVRNRRALLVASTDLSHYQAADRAAVLDGEVMRHVSRLDADGLMSELERFPEHACGGGPTVSVMLAARALGATTAKVLKYADSGDVTGEKDSVVGYMAAALY
jgi:AmmeMemoRadiSam system protein B